MSRLGYGMTKIINSSPKWEGLWKTRGGTVVRVTKDALPLYNDNGLHVADADLDLMERVREGSKEYEQFNHTKTS